MAKKFSASGHSFPAAFGFKQSAGAVGVKSHLRAAPKRAPAPAALPAAPAGGYPAKVATVAAGLNKPAAAASGNAPSGGAPVPRGQRGGGGHDMAGFAKGGKVCKY